MKERIKRNIPTKRRLIQLYSALMYNANIRGFEDGRIYAGTVKSLCVPGLNCYSCPGAVGACPLGALQNALAASDKRAPYYILGIILLFGLALGRTICGFLCPMGLVQELLYKIPTPKLRKSKVTRVFSLLKYGILAVFVLYIPLKCAPQHFPVPAFCKYICPAGTLEGAVSLLAGSRSEELFPMLGGLFTQKIVIAIVIFTAAVFVFRAFCRFFCPLGALYGLFQRISLIGIRVENDKCTGCGKCSAGCRMDVSCPGDRECINCGACVNACPQHAISWKGATKGRISRKKPESHLCGIALVCAALITLAALAAYTGGAWGFSHDAAPSCSGTVGDDTAVDFTIPLYGEDAGSFSLKSAKGKPVVINFWATWCGPCIRELPCFEQLHEKYGERIEVVGIHANMVTDDVEKYLEETDFTFSFGLDADGSALASFGEAVELPRTVVLDEQGHIVYNEIGSVTLPLLESVVEPLLERSTK